MNYSAYFAIEKKIKSTGADIDRADLISQFTDGKKNSLRELTDKQYFAFLHFLNNRIAPKPEVHNGLDDWQNTPSNNMRRKVYSLMVTQMRYTQAHMEEWLLKYSVHKKKLQEHTERELVDLVSQVEQVYASWVIEINKKNKKH